MQAYGCAGRAGDAVLATMKSNFSKCFSVQDQAWIGSIGRGMAATWRGGRGGMDQEGGERSRERGGRGRGRGRRRGRGRDGASLTCCWSCCSLSWWSRRTLTGLFHVALEARRYLQHVEQLRVIHLKEHTWEGGREGGVEGGREERGREGGRGGERERRD